MNNKRRGTIYERELVNLFKQEGHDSKRAYASNGESLGYGKGVDGVTTTKNGIIFTWQAKKRRKLAEYVYPDPDADIQIIREDRGRSLVVMDLADFLKLLL